MFLERHQAFLAKLATVLLGMLAAWLAAALIWQLVLLMWPPPLVNATAPGASDQATQKSAYDLKKLLAVELFGSSAKPVELSPVAAPVNQAPVRQSRLNIRLLGVLSNDDHGDGVAILKHDGKTHTYAVGEKLRTRESIVLAAVFPEYIEIDRSGARERIDLAKKPEMRGISGGDEAAQPRSLSRNASASTYRNAGSSSIDLSEPAMRQVLGDVRETLRSNPLKLARYIRLNPRLVGSGPKGYALSAGPDKALFQQLGLRDGDLVTHINDQALASANLAELRSLLDSGAALQISLLRNGEQQTLNVTL